MTLLYNNRLTQVEVERGVPVSGIDFVFLAKKGNFLMRMELTGWEVIISICGASTGTKYQRRPDPEVLVAYMFGWCHEESTVTMYEL
jgi:hypothetical protein